MRRSAAKTISKETIGRSPTASSIDMERAKSSACAGVRTQPVRSAEKLQRYFARGEVALGELICIAATHNLDDCTDHDYQIEAEAPIFNVPKIEVDSSFD
jgi:hypothetical protein